MRHSKKSMEVAFQAARREMPRKVNVVGVALGEKERGGQPTGQQAVLVLVQTKVSQEHLSQDDLIPKAIRGVQTDVIQVGTLEAHTAEFHQGYHQPFMPGDEIGPLHTEKAGTLGAILRVRLAGHPTDVALTNWHVVEKDGDSGFDHEIRQPAWSLPGQPNPRIIGHVVRAVKVWPGLHVNNLVDAALIELNNADLDPPYQALGGPYPGTAWDRHLDQLVEAGSFDPVGAPLLGWPHYHKDFTGSAIRHAPQRPVSGPAGLGTCHVNDTVWKSGRTTGVTEGTIKSLRCAANINYGGLGLAHFEEQLLIRSGPAGPFSQPGDSGSGIIDEHGFLVGLLFAGSDIFTLANPIQQVFSYILSKNEQKLYNMDREASGPVIFY